MGDEQKLKDEYWKGYRNGAYEGKKNILKWCYALALISFSQFYFISAKLTISIYLSFGFFYGVCYRFQVYENLSLNDRLFYSVFDFVFWPYTAWKEILYGQNYRFQKRYEEDVLEK